jgi:diadenosine tetraphosphate (Ap4A) HIT family hydrolase/acyl-coenzyme A thioesterase PaaI-like protein
MILSEQLTVLVHQHFTVEACGTCYIPGYLIVTPRDAVESLSQMKPAVLMSLGPMLALTTAAIEAVVRPQRVYCTLFSEETHLVHFHLFPRTEWLTAKYFAAHSHDTEISGPRLMDWARQTFHEPIAGMDRDGAVEKIRVQLTSTRGVARMKASITELPFNNFLGIHPATDAVHLLQLPSGRKYLNHLGTVHAAAQLALAEATSSEFLLRHFGSTDRITPVVRRLEAKFRKPANGSFTSTASATPESLAKLDAELSTKGRAIIPIAVELHDEQGTHTLSATVEWFIQRTKDT